MMGLVRYLACVGLLCACRPAAIIAVNVDVVADMVLHRLITVTLVQPGPVSVECTDKEGEVHVLESTSDALVHEMALFGLRGERGYGCSARSGTLETRFDFRTDPLPDWLPEVGTTGTMDGYLLTHHQIGRLESNTDAKVVLFDGDGNIRWYHRLEQHPSDLDVQHVPGVGVLYGGGYEVPPTLVNWFGETVFEGGPSGALGGDYHHHAEWIPGEGILALSRVTDDFEGFEHEGFVVELIDPDTGELLWFWHSIEALEAGTLRLESDRKDPFHANWVAFYGDEMWVELRNQNLILAVDRGTGEILWRFGADRDFRLVGDVSDVGISEDWFSTSHGPDLRDQELLLYDNGVGRAGTQGSRGLIYFLDFEQMSARLIWEFSEEGWYDPIWGDADFVGQDQILLTRAHCSDCSVSGEGTTRFTLVNRESVEIDWELSYLGAADSAYRSEFLGACQVFNNRSMCTD